MCSRCKYRKSCVHPCPRLTRLLPGPDEGKIHFNGSDSQEVLGRIAARRELTHRLISGRHVLRGRARRIFNLYFNDALTHSEIAARLGVSRCTVRYHFMRALVTITAWLIRRNLRERGKISDKVPNTAGRRAV